MIQWGLILFWFFLTASASHGGDIILKAARRHLDLAKRSEEISLTNQVTLSYSQGEKLFPIREPFVDPLIETPPDHVGPKLVSTFQMSSNEPTLFL